MMSAQVDPPVERFAIDTAAGEPTVGECVDACNAAVGIQIAQLRRLQKLNTCCRRRLRLQ